MVEVTKAGKPRQRAVGGGPKPKLSTQLKDALAGITGDIPQIIAALKRVAIGEPVICQHCGKETGTTKPDRESCQYLLDRVLGRPRQEIDQRFSGKITLTADQYELASRIAKVEETNLLNEGVIEGEFEEK